MMDDESEWYLSRLKAVDTETLTPLVRKRFGDPTLDVSEWKYEAVSGGFGGAAGPSLIYRFSGSCKSRDYGQLWSLILKLVLPRKEEKPADPKYWKREYEFYRANLLADLPSGIAAPRGYGVVDYPDEAVWIWMEDIPGDLEQPWSEEQYARIGRHFGQFNGAYLSGNIPMPTASWLSVDWMPKMMAFMEEVEKVNTTIPAALAHPLVKNHFPPDSDKQYLRLWDERELFLEALEHLPQTFAHQDGTGRNLFARLIGEGEYETVATDWAFAGQAAVGLDGAMPVIIDVFMGDLDSSKAEAYDKLVFNGYVDGLQAADWKGSKKQVRLGYTAATALKYLELITPVRDFTDEMNYDWLEEVLGKPAAFWLDALAGMHRYAVKLADEARELAN